MDLDWVWPLKTLLASSVLDCVQSGLRLLCILSGHPANQVKTLMLILVYRIGRCYHGCSYTILIDFLLTENVSELYRLILQVIYQFKYQTYAA